MTPMTPGATGRRGRRSPFGSARPANKPPSPIQQWWKDQPANVRKQLTVGGVVLVYLLILGIGGWYNVSMYLEQERLEQDIASYERELARAPQIRADALAEQGRRGELQRRSDELYARFPDVGAVPVIVGQLERLASEVGGRVTDIQYTPPFWDGERGQVAMRLSFVGQFDGIVKYMESVSRSVATLHWDFFDIQPSDERGNDLVLTASIRLDVLRSRPDGAAAWREDFVQPAIGPREGSPFAVPVVSVARPMPPVELHGIVQQNGRSMALVLIDGVSHVLRTGQSAGGVTVVQILKDSVVVGNGDRTAVIRLID